MKPNDQIQSILDKHRGLRAEELDQMNPSYSCVICGNKECPNVGKANCCCPDHVLLSEEEFALMYDFDRTEE